MNIFAIIALLVWVYILTVLNRAKLDFFKFMIGSVGLFIFGLIWLKPLVIVPLSSLVSITAGIVGELFGVFQAYSEYNVLFVSTQNASISLYIDFECSGVIEILAYISMLLFFPIYNIPKKIFLSVIGFLWIFISNVIRICVICFVIHNFGVESFHVAHTVIGRIVFYGLSIILYYFVFTKAHIVNQKVGGFNYAGNMGTSV